MSTAADPLQFVLSSSVRSEVLRAVAAGAATTDDLLEVVDASSSAVYDALGRLEDAGYLHSAGDDWSLSGSGRLIADFVAERSRMETLLADARRYLLTHDTTAVPDPFRVRMSDLAGGTVITASETEPQAVVREVSERLSRAETAQIVSPIYDQLFEDAMPQPADSRVVVDPEVVLSVATDQSEDAIEAMLSAYSDYRIRVTDVDFSLAVTDDCVMLSLPATDGSYDTQAEFVAEHERARQWGWELYETLWGDATPLSAHVADVHL